MDAVVQSGVPNVLGYRWRVRDQSALKFADMFYESFGKTLSVQRACLQARSQLYGLNASDETWISPILVVQWP
jgi:CHAT domain-containing protein